MSPIENQNQSVEAIHADFAKLRSQWIDALAELEAEVCRSVHRLTGKLNCSRQPLAQRLIELKATVTPSITRSKISVGELRSLVVKIEHEAMMRSTMAHGVMTFGKQNNQTAAFFRNAFESARNIPIYLVMKRVDIEERCATVKALQDKLAKFR